MLKCARFLLNAFIILRIAKSFCQQIVKILDMFFPKFDMAKQEPFRYAFKEPAAFLVMGGR